MHVALPDHVRGEEPSAARHVEQYGAGPQRDGDEGTAGRCEPVERNEGPTRLPPLLDQVVVLLRVVALAGAGLHWSLSRTDRAGADNTGTMIPLLRAAHLQPTLAVTGIATILALATDRGAGTTWVTLAVLAGQLTVGWSNDYLDRDRDRRAQRSDKPIAAGQVSADTVRRAAIVAAVACVPLSLMSGWAAGLVHIGAVAVACSYNAWLKSTWLSPLPYAVSFGAVPVFIALGAPAHELPPLWTVFAAGLLGVGAHFVNTLPDLEVDARLGVHGVPQHMGPTRSLLIAAILMAVAAAILAVAPPGRPDVLAMGLLIAAGAAVAGVVIVGLTGHERAAWTLTLCTAGVALLLFLAQGASLIA